MLTSSPNFSFVTTSVLLAPLVAQQVNASEGEVLRDSLDFLERQANQNECLRTAFI